MTKENKKRKNRKRKCTKIYLNLISSYCHQEQSTSSHIHHRTTTSRNHVNPSNHHHHTSSQGLDVSWDYFSFFFSWNWDSNCCSIRRRVLSIFIKKAGALCHVCVCVMCDV